LLKLQYSISEAFNWESSLGVKAFFNVGTERSPRAVEQALKVFNMGFVIWARGCETSILSIQVGERMA
jgi:hypothetical protein